MGSPFELTGKLALITGGGTGLGMGMARAIVNAGGKVVLTGRREEQLRFACEELGSAASCIQHDITRLDTIPGLVSEMEERFGPVDILINNAGNHLKKSVAETSDEGFAEVLMTHVQGGFALTREFAGRMVARQSGAILFVSSMAAIMGVPNVIAYTAAKTAISGMVRGLASELSPHGVRVNAIVPGWIESDMTNKAFAGDPERARKILSRTPMGRLGSPEDIGNAAVYLCSPAARFVTGVDLRIDGGAGIGF
ncbi:SDR family oxidoreductase [Paenibacillus sp. N4]|uniref:SDR family NAD(P)-dependent oxidoreductase n=1 Tax=Paenibacillus vietnamensis TaxID=2590547 RepID=UPI001CD0AE69|nr:SDR family oxidoreductase [Paenibacillus vietnamensis]MCA0757634.1 SDR family oxidoreductase [Paenibacillus vietnamensis]